MNNLTKFNRFAFNQYIKCTELNKSAFIQYVKCTNCGETCCPKKGCKLGSYLESDMTVYFNYKYNKPELKYSLFYPFYDSNNPYDSKEYVIHLAKIGDYSRLNSWILAIILNSNANIVIKLKEVHLRELMEKIINLKRINQYSNIDNIQYRNITLEININSIHHVPVKKLVRKYKGYQWTISNKE